MAAAATAEGTTARSFKAVGAAGIVAGVFVLARLLPGYAQDAGWVSNGSSLKQHWLALAAMAPAAAAAYLGLRLVRRATPTRTATALVVITAAVAPLAMGFYPRSTTATVVALDPSGAELWRASTPAEGLHGVRSSTDGVLVVEGVVTKRDCNYDLVSITIDRVTGKVISVDKLPMFYPTPEAVPPRPAPPSPSEFRFEQGESAVFCSR